MNNIYAQLLTLLFTGTTMDLDTDTIKMGLLDSGYTPDFTADTYWSDVSAHEITGTGYSADGLTLASTNLFLLPANSWGASWVTATPYAYGQIVSPTVGNGYIYRVVVAGTSGGSEPTWPTTPGEVVTDGGVTWACLGDAALVFTSNPAIWATATFTANYAVIYDAQSGVPSTSPLIVCQTFPSPQSPVATNFEIDPDPQGGWFTFSPPS